ncbi:MAG: type II toxin-antitoxin system VapC family toxin [Syntrophobacteraceae bacterium]|jgi:tRNA(fMet)-specific endonuclease VapC
MKVSYLVDTDWIIDHLANVAVITQKLRELQPRGIALSVISLAELYEGVYYSRDPQQNQSSLHTFLRKFPVLGVDREICQFFGRERGKLRKAGRMIGDFDLLIASTCLCHDLTLLTNNVGHFERIEGLRLFSISK